MPARFDVATTISVLGSNASLEYAVSYLEAVGAGVVRATLAEESPARTLLCATPSVGQDDIDGMGRWYNAVVTVSDYQTGIAGRGELAAAASGLSWVIGEPSGIPRSVAPGMPERWTGALAASVALAWDRASGRRPGRTMRIDVSAADVLRSFVDQCAGNSVEVQYAWRRNGRLAVEHGGVFPQGFFRCKDGYVAMVARSRGDWLAILRALGDPPWAAEERFQNPIALSHDDGEVAPLLEATTSSFTRRELLDRALEFGATMAPVLQPGEAAEWGLTAEGQDGRTPFCVVENE